MTIQEKIDILRDQRWLEDMSRVYGMLQNVVQEEYSTSLEQFLMDYYALKKKLS
jgi:GTP cyclohydrolase FolE2